MMNLMNLPLASLSGRTAVVIGGTSAIGRVLALGFAAAGADVVASSRRVEQVESTAREIESLARRSLRIACDVCDRASLENLLAKTLETLGKVDILVNCAGKIKRAPTINFPEESWRDILETNLTGMLRGCQIFGRHILERGYGRIINVASLNTFVSLAEVAAYAASKAAVGALTRSLAVEWSSRGVMVNAIAPGVSVQPLIQICSTTQTGVVSCWRALPWVDLGRQKSWWELPCTSHRMQHLSQLVKSWWWTGDSWQAVQISKSAHDLPQ
jgi:NAD(P)-dependent dehydrogenase (short-subunit alcohol dehydrogenase family)